MRTVLSRIWNASPAVLAFSILAVQVAIPFSAQNFQTTDGSSYVYSAVVARDLLVHPDSSYSSVYQFRHALVPNWGGTLLLNVILSFVGVDYAEKVLMSVTMLIGFFSIAFCIRCFAPGVSPWTPLTNFVLQNWIIWTGFYSFYLSAMAGLLLIAFYVRRPGKMSIRTALILSAGLVGVFALHLMGAALAMLGIGVLAAWRWIVEPQPVDARARWQQVGLVAATMVPTLAFALVFALSSGKPVRYTSSPTEALASFPLATFNTAGGLIGEQTLLWPVVLLATVFVIARLSRREWKTARGGLAMAVIVSFAVYLFLPDRGFGGGQSKLRFAWAIFLFGTVLISSTFRFAALRIGLGLYASILLAFNLAATTRVLFASSAAVSDYLAAVGELPYGSRIVRVRYDTPDIPVRYGFPGLDREPLLRVDGLIAARCHCIDLTEYQAINYIFPVIMHPGISLDRLDEVWHDFESPGHRTRQTLAWLRESTLGPIDYVIIVADRLSPVNFESLPSLTASLNEMELKPTAKSLHSPFIRVYARSSENANR